MKVLAITQARISSTRLPGKVLKEISNKSLLEMHIERVKKSKFIDQFVVATTDEEDVSPILNISNKLSIETFRGSLYDVLDRFYYTYKKFGADIIVRVTSDCPLIDPSVIDSIIVFFKKHNCDYVSNTLRPTFPDGIDVEVFRASALEKAWKEACLKSEREHVSSYIWSNSTYFNKDFFSAMSFENPVDCSQYRFTVDTIDDFDRIKKLVELVGVDASWEEYVHCVEMNKIIFEKIKSEERNLGYKKSLENDV